jgi:hypothetical protein
MCNNVLGKNVERRKENQDEYDIELRNTGDDIKRENNQ